MCNFSNITENGLLYKLGDKVKFYVNEKEEDKINIFSNRMKTCRILINTPASQGGIGDIYNTNMPSLTLGCGSFGGNSTTSNVSSVFGFLFSSSKNESYFVVSKSFPCFKGYFRGRPLPRFCWPSSNSGCFVFLWLFNAGWLKNDLPQSHEYILPSCSCLERLCLSIYI